MTNPRQPVTSDGTTNFNLATVPASQGGTGLSASGTDNTKYLRSDGSNGWELAVPSGGSTSEVLPPTGVAGARIMPDSACGQYMYGGVLNGEYWCCDTTGRSLVKFDANGQKHVWADVLDAGSTGGAVLLYGSSMWVTDSTQAGIFHIDLSTVPYAVDGHYTTNMTDVAMQLAQNDEATYLYYLTGTGKFGKLEQATGIITEYDISDDSPSGGSQMCYHNGIVWYFDSNDSHVKGVDPTDGSVDYDYDLATFLSDGYSIDMAVDASNDHLWCVGTSGSSYYVVSIKMSDGTMHKFAVFPDGVQPKGIASTNGAMWVFCRTGVEAVQYVPGTSVITFYPTSEGHMSSYAVTLINSEYLAFDNLLAADPSYPVFWGTDTTLHMIRLDPRLQKPGPRLGHIKRKLTSTELLAINTTPVFLFGKKGTGKNIVPIFATWHMTYGSTTYASGGNLQICKTGGTQPLVNFGTGYTQAASSFGVGALSLGATQAMADYEDSEYYLTTATSDPTTGDSDVIVEVWYTIIPNPDEYPNFYGSEYD